MARGDRQVCILLVPLLSVLVVAAAEPSAARARSEPPVAAVVVRRADGVTTQTLRDAVRLASHWLSAPRCQQVFTDFRDARGRTLAENLQTAGKTAIGYLGWLSFWDGTHERPCIWSDAFAATQPGSRVVFLCPVFKKLQGNPEHAAAIVIHEELHSLGLGENPPSSLEITARVLARCGP